MRESKRVIKFRAEMINTLPKFPNSRETKEALEYMPLATLLIHYLNWVSRYVSVRARKVIIEPVVTADHRWKLLNKQIKHFLEKVSRGENLAPNMSLQPHSKGYSPATSAQVKGVDRWADKDFLLNTMGFYHFHLGTVLEEKGYANRTNDVLFARITREEFIVVGIFDHSVFDIAGELMSEERKRLWDIFDMHTCRSVQSGSVVVSSLIATSGHPVHVVFTASKYARVIRELDSNLDNPVFLKGLYDGVHKDVPRNAKLEWTLDYSDLCIYEKKHRHRFLLYRGFN